MSQWTIDSNTTDDTSADSMINNETSKKDWMHLVIQKDISNRFFDPFTEAAFLLCYSALITFGVLGNGLVIFVVIRNPNMRTPRNIFIINLAISDLTLCLFTQPLNLYVLLVKGWRLGEFLCKFITMAQGTNLFVSTISITAIALDRFQVIVYPTKDSMKRIGAAIALISIWLISFLMASPALLFSVLHRRIWIDEEPNMYIYVCMEDTTLLIEKKAYSVAQMVVQYLMPFIILSVAHLGICNKLRYRGMVQEKACSRHIVTSIQRKNDERRSSRKRKTNLLLGAIALVFAMSWMPLNVLNLSIDFNLTYFKSLIDVTLFYAICHMLVLCSACMNPVLYGWLNENFRNEFIKIVCCPCCAIVSKTIKLLFCWRSRQASSVPTITLTKVSNEHSMALDDGVDSGGVHTLTLHYQKQTFCSNSYS